MSIPSERVTIGILTQNEGKFAAALHAIEGEQFEVVQIADDYPKIQGNSSLEIAESSARRAMRDLNIAIIREDHSMHFDGLEGMPGPYANYTEEMLGVTGLLRALEDSPRTGYYVTSAVLAEPLGKTIIGTTTEINFSVAEEPRGELQSGWSQLIVLDGDDRTLAEYPESERLEAWSSNYFRLAEYLQWRQERVLYITGPHAAGKTAAAKMLFEKHGYPYFDLGPAIRQAHADANSNMMLDSWISENEAVFGQDFTDDLLSHRVAESRLQNRHPRGFAVIGSRSAKGLDYINTHLNPSDTLHLHLDADEPLLHARYCDREQREETQEEFAQRLANDGNMGLKELEQVADVSIRNNESPDAFETAVSRAVRKWELRLPSDELFYID